MFTTAADARFLVASMPTTVPDLELPSMKMPNSDVLGLLLATILGQRVVSWAWQQGGYCQLAAAWLCIELVFYVYTRWRCAPALQRFRATPTFRNGCLSKRAPMDASPCFLDHHGAVTYARIVLFSSRGPG